MKRTIIKSIMNLNDENVFFTSDTHFGHKNILKYCNRPFNSIEEMNEKIIENWNNKVGKNDKVFFLGDFMMSQNPDKAKELINKLNGKKYLVFGNHDVCFIKHPEILYECFNNFSFQMKLKFMFKNIKYDVILNHYPMLCFGGAYSNKESQKTIQLFGHVHSGVNSTEGLDIERLKYLFKNQYDVGVDNNDFTPVSIKEIIFKIFGEKV